MVKPKEVAEAVRLMRRLGVVRMKAGALELELGPPPPPRTRGRKAAPSEESPAPEDTSDPLFDAVR